MYKAQVSDVAFLKAHGHAKGDIRQWLTLIVRVNHRIITFNYVMITPSIGGGTNDTWTVENSHEMMNRLNVVEFDTYG